MEEVESWWLSVEGLAADQPSQGGSGAASTTGLYTERPRSTTTATVFLFPD